MCQVYTTARNDILDLFIGPIDSSYCAGKMRHLYFRLVPWFVGAGHILLDSEKLNVYILLVSITSLQTAAKNSSKN